MRIISKQNLMKLPEGTLFSRYKRSFFDGLYIFSGSFGMPNDFFEVCISEPWLQDCDGPADFFPLLDKMHEGAASATVDLDTVSRESTHDDELFYAIWEKEDLELLKSKIEVALKNTESS